MSLDIDWTKLADAELNESIREFLDEQFQSLSLPSFISNLLVTGFSLGLEAPNITIRHIGDPFNEFYEEEVSGSDQEQTNPDNSTDSDSDDDKKADVTLGSPLPPPQKARMPSDSFFQLHNHPLHSYNMHMGLGLNNSSGTDTPSTIFNHNQYRKDPKHRISHTKAPERDVNDIQLITEIDYSGNLSIEVTVNLLVNYPSTRFITLPIKLHVSDLVIHSIAAIAYLKNAVHLSFICDINETGADYFSARKTSGQHADASGGNFVDYFSSSSNRERIDIIKKVRIESEIGEVEQNVLRNVGKVERFLVEQLRNIIRDEIAWPGWVCFDFNEDDDSIA